MNTYNRYISKWTDEQLEAKRSHFNEVNQSMQDFAQKLNSDLTEYTTKTRDAIKAIAIQMMELCKGDWREHYIKTAKKSELREKMLMVISRTIEDNGEWIDKIQSEIEYRKHIEATKIQSQTQREWFYAKVLPHNDDYIHKFDKISEGIRQWDCLEELCLTGTVTAENIGQYGIDLD